jgi:uracil-DNA glycosylase
MSETKKNNANKESAKKKRVNLNEDLENKEQDNDKINTEVKVNSKKTGIKDYFTVNSKTTSKTNDNIIELEPEKEPIKINANKIEAETNIIKSDKNSKNLSEFDLFIKDIGSWEEPLRDFIHSDKMKNIQKFVEKAYSQDTCYPPKDQIFNAFKRTPWENLKVVIIGQDPYFNKGEAMGLCFSVNKGIKIPPSLRNIYKALVEEKIMKSIPNHGDLSSWADQGVLMLNATMTVKGGVANSHQKTSNWESFTDHVIKVIDSKKKGVVFLLWGAFAQKKAKLLKSGNSITIESIHPSPLAASKGNFGEKRQFTLTNDYLTKSGMTPIDWNIV